MARLEQALQVVQSHEARRRNESFFTHFSRSLSFTHIRDSHQSKSAADQDIMHCTANQVGATSRVWLCDLQSSSAAHHVQRALPTPKCALRPGCCKAHRRDPSCVAAVLDARNAEVIRQHPEYGPGVAPVVEIPGAHVHVSTGLPQPVGGSSPKYLTFVQGYRHTLEYAVQAALFRMRRTSDLVRSSDLLVLCNNIAMDRTMLLRFVSKYPHATRALIHSADNSEGYRCGHLLAISNTGHVWRAYSTVLFLHPDVYLLPRAVSWLHDHVTAHEADAFMVTNMFWNGVAGRSFVAAASSARICSPSDRRCSRPTFGVVSARSRRAKGVTLPERILYRKTQWA